MSNRYFTDESLGALVDEIKSLIDILEDAKQDKLDGSAGQIVGFDENGNAVSIDIDNLLNALNSVYTKDEIDNMEFITSNDIDVICGKDIEVASLNGEVRF